MASVLGTPYQPETDQRLATVETVAQNASSANSTLTLLVGSVANGQVQTGLTANQETVSIVGSTLSSSKVYSILNITGGGTMVLAAPSAAGQKKYINVTAANSSITIALTNVLLNTYTSMIITGSGGGAIFESAKADKWSLVSALVLGNGITFV